MNAAEFFRSTLAVDMAPLYGRFLPRIPPGGHLLDAGCGSGRDAKAFVQRGYRVTACDASPELARLASRHLGQEVLVLRLEDLDWGPTFDGIWACASLLHVPAAALPGVLARLARALQPGAPLYASFKYGQGERQDGERRFTDLDEPGLQALLDRVPGLAPLATWVTADQRPQRTERWLNAVLVGKQGQEA